MTLLAAFRNAAVTEPRRIIARTDVVKCRSGSGLCAEPNAVRAPDTTPKVGGSRVKGRVNAK